MYLQPRGDWSGVGWFSANMTRPGAAAMAPITVPIKSDKVGWAGWGSTFWVGGQGIGDDGEMQASR